MRPRYLFPLLALALLAASPRAAAAAAAGKPIKLATLVPQGSIWDKELRAIAEEAKKRTDGRVTFRVYPGGIEGDDQDVVRKMRLGQLQAASLTVDGLTSLDKGFSIFSVPRFFASFDELFAVAHALTPTLTERLDKQGFVFLGWGYGGWVYLFAKQPFYTPEDVKKLKLFVWGGNDNKMVDWWKSNGYHPVGLASTDIMTGLQTGMIDAMPAPPLIAIALQWYRQAPNMLDLPMGQLIGATVITKKSWEQLSPADRATLKALAAQMQERLEREIPGQDRQAVDEMSRRGLNVTKPRDAKAWDDAATLFANTMREKVVPADLFDMARKAREELRSKH